MDKRLASRLVLVILMLWCCSDPAIAGGGTPNAVLTGTVNIVLANPRGIVVITDSNQTERLSTGEPFTSSLPGQKLFRIDDKTVCTIAGFGATYLASFPEFTSSAAGVLNRYVEELRNKGGDHTFREKLTSLAFLFRFQLAGIGNLQHLNLAQVGDYEFELILAGYDIDGTTKVGKVSLSTSLSPNGVFSPVVKQATEKTVVADLVYETAGVGGAAVENILTYPSQLAEEPEVGRYAMSKAADGGGSLTTAEMEALAKSLTHHSSVVNQHYISGGRIWSPVGGRNQIAILESGTIRKLDQPLLAFEERRVSTKNFGLITGGTFDSRRAPSGSGPVIESGQGFLALIVKARFLGGSIRLDDAYYFDDDFTDANFYYSGGVLGFDRSNRITDCVLRLGPHVDRTSPAIQELINGFPWKRVQ